MDQQKIGRFIAEMRKEKSLTQRELADTLCISDKTISKWENGKGMPEVSLMMPLCEALGITANELLSGERLTQENYIKKAEEKYHDTRKGKGRKQKEDNIIGYRGSYNDHRRYGACYGIRCV